MMQISTMMFIVLIEILVVLLVTTGILLALSMVRKRRDMKAAAALAAKFKKGSVAAESELASVLSEYPEVEGEAIVSNAKAFMALEAAFYQKFLQVYVGRNAAEFSRLDRAVGSIRMAYQEYLKASSAHIGAEGVPVAADASASAPATDQSAEIDRLKSENQRLSDEISVTMDTMGRMLGEYTQLYSNQDGEGMVTMDAILAFARGEEQTDAGRVMATPVDPTDVDDDIEIEVTPTASDEDIANMLAEAGAGAAPEPVTEPQAEVQDDAMDELNDKSGCGGGVTG
ncbi:MAG TPA: hypothetical protein EYN73_02950 [Chromatiaceae bacterium]|nr:hypothetical protein [Chromatiaceae bacterium]HIN81316.1 hypothetical protein [Chromatiales bacterium]